MRERVPSLVEDDKVLRQVSTMVSQMRAEDWAQHRVEAPDWWHPPDGLSPYWRVQQDYPALWSAFVLASVGRGVLVELRRDACHFQLILDDLTGGPPACL